jgi:hypothetical protein
MQIKATDDLVIDLWPGTGPDDPPLLKLRSLATEADGEAQAIFILLNEVRPLVAALTEAVVTLAERAVSA